jgi:hypothetical protein
VLSVCVLGMVVVVVVVVVGVGVGCVVGLQLVVGCVRCVECLG